MIHKGVTAMTNRMFGNSQILAWLQYYSDNTQIDLERVKILDITRKNKNLIPTVESNDAVLVFTEAGHADIFYRMWSAGLGECDVWYNTGSEPSGPIEHSKLKNMIDRGINASAAMLVLNPNARSTYKIGMHNTSFSRGSIHYVGSEIRAVILNKMRPTTRSASFRVSPSRSRPRSSRARERSSRSSTTETTAARWRRISSSSA